MATGELIGAIAMTEPGAGSDLQGIKTRAEQGRQPLSHQRLEDLHHQRPARQSRSSSSPRPTRRKGAKGTSLIVVETDEAEGFERGRNLDKIGLKANDTSELFFNDVRVPTANLLGREEGQGFVQLMQQLPQERLQIGTQAIAMVERALALTIDYVKERKAFGKAIIDFQNTQFKLAELKTEATIGRVFYNDCVDRHIAGGLDAATASMAKYWLSDLQGKVVDECLQLLRRLWLHERVSDRPHVPRRPRAAHLWRHQRDHEAADRARASEPRRSESRGESKNGRSLCLRRRAHAARARQEGRLAARGAGGPARRQGAGGAARPQRARHRRPSTTSSSAASIRSAKPAR